MASMIFSSPSTQSFLSSSSHSSSSFNSCHPLFLASKDSRTRLFARNSIRCDIGERPLNSVNGSPIFNEGTKLKLPKFLESAVMENYLNINTNSRIKLFSGSANPALSQEVASSLGLELGKIKRKRFADGETYVQLEESVRGCDVYILQPTCPPVNENLMELNIMIDDCWRASAKSITVVIPYFGYARADRQTECRESITAKLVANQIAGARADRVIVCDIHSLQSIGYFDIPVDHVYCEVRKLLYRNFLYGLWSNGLMYVSCGTVDHGQPVILDYLASKAIHSNDLAVVSPDVGGVARARAFAKKLGAPLAIVDKRRQGHNTAEVMNLIGDVKGKVAIMVDDMIDTAGTISKGAELLHQEGAREVYACCTHAVFSPPAIERLSSGLFQEVIVTNTTQVAEKNFFPQLTVLSIARLLAETIWRVHNACSVSSIFQ